MTSWRETLSLDKPKPLALDGDNYMQTRNVVEIPESKDDRGEIILKHYKYDLRWMTISEYEMLSAMQNIYKGESEV